MKASKRISELMKFEGIGFVDAVGLLVDKTNDDQDAVELLPYTNLGQFTRLCLRMGKDWVLQYAPGVAVDLGFLSKEAMNEFTEG